MANQTNDTEIELRAIKREDWSWVTCWFDDAWLNKELGPVDKEWLDCVLSEADGIELVAELNEQPIGLIGIKWSTAEHPFHTITDLAINPTLRGRGLGRSVLKAAMVRRGHPNTDKWITFTAEDNDSPARLLLSMGWHSAGKQNGMNCFEFFM